MINFFVLRIIGIWYNFCAQVWRIICTFVLKTKNSKLKTNTYAIYNYRTQ